MALFQQHRSQIYSRSLLLSLDLDGTLVGDNPAQILFNLVWLKFFHFSDQHNLVYNTARDMSGLESSLVPVHPFIWPQFMILQVGGYIYQYDPPSQTYQTIPEYTTQLVQHFPWKQINQRIAQIKELQEPKIKFFNEPVNFWMRLAKEEVANQEAIRQLEALQEQIKEEGGEMKLILSGEQDSLDIDIVPSRGGKGAAMHYLETLLGGRDMVISAGDAHTDTDMFGYSQVGLVVANSQPGLLSWVHRQKPCRQRRVVLSQHSHANAITAQLVSLLSGHVH